MLINAVKTKLAYSILPQASPAYAFGVQALRTREIGDVFLEDSVQTGEVGSLQLPNKLSPAQQTGHSWGQPGGLPGGGVQMKTLIRQNAGDGTTRGACSPEGKKAKAPQKPATRLGSRDALLTTPYPGLHPAGWIEQKPTSSNPQGLVIPTDHPSHLQVPLSPLSPEWPSRPRLSPASSGHMLPGWGTEAWGRDPSQAAPTFFQTKCTQTGS